MVFSPRFSGVVCPSITVTHDDGTIDYERWGKHLDHLIDAGIDGVLIFGSIGEFYAFDLQTKEQVVDFVVKHVNGRMKVFAGVGDTDIDRVLEFAKSAEKSGVDAVVAVSPYYFGPSPDAARIYFGKIADTVSIPVILYNFPARTGSDLTPELVADLAKNHPNIVGMKDTVDTISHTRKVIRAARAVNPDFAVFSGFDEYYLVNRVSGGVGVISGLTNVEPETFVTLRNAYDSGDMETTLTAAARISKLMAVYDQADLFISAIKGAVKAKGLDISTLIREPAAQLTDEQYRKIVQILS